MNTEPINRRLLIVDDHQVIHDAFRAIFAAPPVAHDRLDEFEGSLFGSEKPAPSSQVRFSLDHVFQGEEALAKVIASHRRQTPYAVAFVDMRMPPGWDGLDTIDRLFQEDDQLQVVMCTAYSDYTWGQVLDRLGCTDRLLLLKKPFATEEVLQLAIALTEKYRLLRTAQRHLRKVEESNDQLQTEIDERRKAQELLTLAATHDGLTNLPNRSLFVESLQRAIAAADATRANFDAILFIDVDDFKTINDMLGHIAGDQFLRIVAERLRANYRSSDASADSVVDLPARLGGDEFVVLIRNLKTMGEAVSIAKRLMAVLKEPFVIDEHQLVVTVSVGIAAIGCYGTSPDQVLRNADVAMYQAKLAGKDQLAVFDQVMHAAVVRRLEIEAALRTAIERQEMHLEYQPIYTTSTQQLAGFEALLRWQHSELGDVGPSEFIPIAEETTLMSSIGAWIIEEACRQLHAWRTAIPHSANLRLSINVSKKQLVRPEFAESVERIVAKYPGVGASLNFEVTESAVMSDPDLIVQVLTKLRALGIHIHMDDFGTGHSSLSCLHRFPIDVLKIDRSFVVTMESNPDYESVVHAIVTLAHHMEVAVVAEGVELFAHLDALRSLGCDYVQGFYFSKSLSVEDATDWIIEHGTSPLEGQMAELLTGPSR